MYCRTHDTGTRRHTHCACAATALVSSGAMHFCAHECAWQCVWRRAGHAGIVYYAFDSWVMRTSGIRSCPAHPQPHSSSLQLHPRPVLLTQCNVRSPPLPTTSRGRHRPRHGLQQGTRLGRQLARQLLRPAQHRSAPAPPPASRYSCGYFPYWLPACT